MKYLIIFCKICDLICKILKFRFSKNLIIQSQICRVPQKLKFVNYILELKNNKIRFFKESVQSNSNFKIQNHRMYEKLKFAARKSFYYPHFCEDNIKFSVIKTDEKNDERLLKKFGNEDPIYSIIKTLKLSLKKKNFKRAEYMCHFYTIKKMKVSS